MTKRVAAWFRRRVAAPVMDQLRRGTTPEKIALTIAIGMSLGVFPLLGTTTVLCFTAAIALGLNQPVIQLVNYLVYPLQFPLIYFFVRVGERIAGARSVPFDVKDLAAAFAADPISFVGRFGITGLHGILGWLMIAVPATGLMYLGLVPLLRRTARGLAPAVHEESFPC